MLDPATAVFVAMLMMLINGAVLGFARRDLPRDLRPSADAWRIGTLVVAGGCALLAAQRWLPPAWSLPLANGLVLLGTIGYWRALRLFYGLRDTPWILLPLPPLVLGVWVSLVVWQNMPLRIGVATAAWVVVLLGCVGALKRAPAGDNAISRRVLIALCGGLAGFLLLRCLVLLVRPQALGAIVDPREWNMLDTPLASLLLPVIGTTAFLQLCSERIRRQWEHAASTDHLTGLANRRTLTHEGEARLRAALPERGLALAVIDIDNFKSINDRLGHEAGDTALKHVAERLRAGCNPGDLPARQGGEEFVVLLHAASVEAAREQGERLRAAVENAPLDLPEGPLRMTVSVGVALAGEGDRQLDDLLRRADQALYTAKREGRNRVVSG